MAGDERALDMPGLATIHTLFLREHNRIARQLNGRGLSPERIYQVTKLPANLQKVFSILFLNGKLALYR